MVARLSRGAAAAFVGIMLCLVAGLIPGTASPATAASLGSCRGTSSVYTCVKIVKHLSTSFHQTGSDGEDNTTPLKHMLTCSIKKTSSYSWGLSINVSAEARAWIFAKVSAQVGAHFDKTEGSETSVSTTMPVPPHTTVICRRGTEVQTWRVRKCVYTSHSSQCTYFRWHAPMGLIWRTSQTKD